MFIEEDHPKTMANSGLYQSQPFDQSSNGDLNDISEHHNDFLNNYKGASNGESYILNKIYNHQDIIIFIFWILFDSHHSFNLFNSFHIISFIYSFH